MIGMKTRTMRKGLFAAVAALAVGFAFSEDGIIVDDAGGRISIGEGVSGISFDTSGDRGASVGYVVYPRIVSAGDHINVVPVQRGINVGNNTTIWGLNEGDSVGFYYIDSAGETFNSDLLNHVGGATFGVVFSGGEVGGGALTISNIKTKPCPSGMPLPGFLAILLVGGAGAGALKLRKHRS